MGSTIMKPHLPKNPTFPMVPPLRCWLPDDPDCPGSRYTSDFPGVKYGIYVPSLGEPRRDSRPLTGGCESCGLAWDSPQIDR